MKGVCPSVMTNGLQTGVLHVSTRALAELLQMVLDGDSIRKDLIYRLLLVILDYCFSIFGFLLFLRFLDQRTEL